MTEMDEVVERARGVLPSEDLAFASQSDDEIASLARKHSFDRDMLLKRMRVRNRSQQVLIAHLYLDHILGALLTQQLSRPKAIDLDRMTFSQKTQFAVAIGAFDEVEAAALKAINVVRNKLAHTLSFVVSDADLARVRAATPKFLNDWAMQPSGRKARRITLSVLLTGIVWLAELRRQQAHERRLLSRKRQTEMAALMLEARRVLGETN